MGLFNLKKKKEEKYREQFVSNITINNNCFGELTFEEDSNKDYIELVNGMNDVMFGNQKIEEVRIEISKDKLDYALELLEKTIKDADTILKNYHNEILESDDYYDKDGNLIDTNTIENHTKINMISVNDDEIIFWGKTYDIYENDGTPYEYDADFGIKVYLEENDVEIFKF